MRIGLTIGLALLAVGLSGCGHEKKPGAGEAPRLHVAVPPHGGTPVALGDDYQIECVRDAPSGRLQAYILDGEMENFVRITPPAFDVTAQLPGGHETLHLTAVANSATGEKVGDTSLFEAQADWLKTIGTFTAAIRQIDIKGTTFSNVTFALAK
jgi:hypothetical protein